MGTDKVPDLDQPMPGPEPVGPEYTWEPDWDMPLSYSMVVGRFFTDLVRTPVHWIRKTIVEPNRGPKYYWYHRKYGRALPVDECYIDDLVCMHEANVEYRRGFMVDRATLDLLRYRRDSCYFWHTTKHNSHLLSDDCKDLEDTYKREEVNFFIKYGDMHFGATVIHAYNKQKQRMIMERRLALRQMAREATEGEAEKAASGHT